MYDEKNHNEVENLEKQILEINHLLEKLPAKDFYCSKNGNSYKWYSIDGKNAAYIPKKNRNLAEKLALRKYLLCKRNDLDYKKELLEKYLSVYDSKESQAEKLLHRAPEYKNLISTYFKPVSKELEDWMKEPFESNPKYPEQLIHKTFSGKYVRSKSEAMIDMLLHMRQIPFRYEAKLELGDVVIYPDFTIRHPKTGEYYYFEHFGKMDDYSYCQKMHTKLRTYTMHGIFPGIQLNTTYETKEYPLSAEMVEKIIEYYFC